MLALAAEHHQPRAADDRGQRRSRQHPESHRRVVLVRTERERADEQRHGEADARHDRYAVQGRPSAACGELSDTAAHGEPARGEDTELFTDEEAEDDAERDRLGERVKAYALE